VNDKKQEVRKVVEKNSLRTRNCRSSSGIGRKGRKGCGKKDESLRRSRNPPPQLLYCYYPIVNGPQQTRSARESKIYQGREETTIGGGVYAKQERQTEGRGKKKRGQCSFLWTHKSLD